MVIRPVGPYPPIEPYGSWPERGRALSYISSRAVTPATPRWIASSSKRPTASPVFRTED